jgi:hypothetical protein
MTLCHIQKCQGTWHRWIPEARAGRKGAAVRSKRQHPLRRFAPAAVASVGLVGGASSSSSAANSAATGKTALTTITIALPAAAVFAAVHIGSLAQVQREGILAKADNCPLKDPSSASAALAGSFAGLSPALIAQTILPA